MRWVFILITTSFHNCSSLAELGETLNYLSINYRCERWITSLYFYYYSKKKKMISMMIRTREISPWLSRLTLFQLGDGGEWNLVSIKSKFCGNKIRDFNCQKKNSVKETTDEWRLIHRDPWNCIIEFTSEFDILFVCR